jgi:hypothetical protein
MERKRTNSGPFMASTSKHSIYPWHALTGWYVYRRMTNTTLLEVAFAPELAGRSIGKTLYHEVEGPGCGPSIPTVTSA